LPAGSYFRSQKVIIHFSPTVHTVACIPYRPKALYGPASFEKSCEI
jgi:hypothetical protein